MHIVDEVLAYRELVENRMHRGAVRAIRHHRTPALKLAKLAPKLLDVMREDSMSIERARALAISDSHAEQERVWFDSPTYNRDPRSLRAMLTREHVRSTDRLARFVGLEAYEAAGGGVVRNLFGEDTSTFLTDQPLLTRLAVEVLERAAEPLKTEGWRWVETSLEATAIWGHNGYGRIVPQTRDMTDDERAELAALGESFDDVQAQIDAYAEDDPAIEADESRLVDTAHHGNPERH